MLHTKCAAERSDVPSRVVPRDSRAHQASAAQGVGHEVRRARKVQAQLSLSACHGCGAMGCQQNNNDMLTIHIQCDMTRWMKAGVNCLITYRVICSESQRNCQSESFTAWRSRAAAWCTKDLHQYLADVHRVWRRAGH